MPPRAHFAVMFRIASQMSLVAASSVGVAAGLDDLAQLRVHTLEGVGGVEHRDGRRAETRNRTAKKNNARLKNLPGS